MPKVSVIVPVYKVEAYLHRCIDSILGQTYVDFELILVEDGSPDSCGAICDEYGQKDSRVCVIHQGNGGLSAARNAGIDWVFANSDSQWLTFVDSDDWLEEDCLSQLYFAAKETGCQVSACALYQTSGETLLEKGETSVQRLSADDYYCSNDQKGAVPAVACGKLYHRSLFEDLRFPVGKLHEDEFTTYRALYKTGSIGVTNAQLYAYFQNDAGIMRSSWSPRRMDALEAFEQQIAFAKQTDNERLLLCVNERYVWCIIGQLEQIKALGSAQKGYLKPLRTRLREALKRGNLAFNRKNLVFYEAAYPVKPLWRAAHAVYNAIRKDR